MRSASSSDDSPSPAVADMAGRPGAPPMLGIGTDPIERRSEDGQEQEQGHDTDADNVEPSAKNDRARAVNLSPFPQLNLGGNQTLILETSMETQNEESNKVVEIKV